MTKVLTKVTAVVATLALSFTAFAGVASADDHQGPRGHRHADTVSVRNMNDASIENSASAMANTGDNQANGAEGGSAGNGGSVSNDDGDQDVEKTDTGAGGAAGHGGNGGDILTGDAVALTAIANDVNKNRTHVRNCDCEGRSHVRVHNRNRAELSNDALADANSGRNYADAGRGGDAGHGGDVSNVDDEQEVDDTTTGNGGRGGNGGHGGRLD